MSTESKGGVPILSAEMIEEFSREATPAEASSFYHEAKQQLDHVLIGEDRAREDMIASAVDGGIPVLIGPPGGGKSLLTGNFYRLFSGVSMTDVAKIPPDAELSSAQLAGDRLDTTKTTTRKVGDKTTEETEKTSIDVNPLVSDQTMFIWYDEIPRTSPYALNMLLSANEEGVLTTTAGQIVLGRLVMAYSTMNPAENSQSMFPISSAQASRHSRGIPMGIVTPAQRLEIVSEMVNENWEETPEEMKSVITIPRLMAIRKFAGKLPFDNKVGDYAVKRIIEANDLLSKHGVVEADGRLAQQVKRGSKAYAAIQGRLNVDDDSVDKAVAGAVIGRLGMLRRMPTDKIVDVAWDLVKAD